jgi:hypothetical protein
VREARPASLEQRVVRAAEAALAEQEFVAAIDVLVGLGWLPPARLEEWRQWHVDYLERVIAVNLTKLSRAMRLFRCWAQRRGLIASEAPHRVRAAFGRVASVRRVAAVGSQASECGWPGRGEVEALLGLGLG